MVDSKVILVRYDAECTPLFWDREIEERYSEMFGPSWAMQIGKMGEAIESLERDVVYAAN